MRLIEVALGGFSKKIKLAIGRLMFLLATPDQDLHSEAVQVFPMSNANVRSERTGHHIRYWTSAHIT